MVELVFSWGWEVVVVQLPHHVRLFATPWTAAPQASLSFTVSQSLLKLMSIESMMPSNHLILCLTLLLCPQSFPASGSFPMSQLCIRWPKYWSFSFSISLPNEYSGLISYRIDWFDLAVQRTVKSLNAWSDIKVLTTCHIVNSSPKQTFTRLFLPITCMTCFLLSLL